jgi:hypothetical protein
VFSGAVHLWRKLVEPVVPRIIQTDSHDAHTSLDGGYYIIEVFSATVNQAFTA